MLGEDDASRYLADLVAGATDTLQAAGNRRRCLHLDDQVDGAHVDSEFETAGGDDASQSTRFEVVFDEGSLVFADRSVVGASKEGFCAVVDLGGSPDLRGRARCFLDGQTDAFCMNLVEPGCQSFGEAARVGEHDGRSVVENEVDDLFLDVGPDRTGLRGGRFGTVVRRRDPQFGHVLDGNTDREVECLGGRRCHDSDRCRTGEEPPDLLVRTDSGRQSDALRRTLEQAVQAFQ